ncbi:MAG: DUF6382 domain-containing protein [Lachnospiraceae bacterium]|nr:DUF6382 domain-containing protein [Lachnospiraceae bacterium]
MEIEYRRDLNHNYVVLESEKEIATDSYQVRMILANDIGGFLSCTIQQLDRRALFCYEMTSRQSLASLLEHREVEAERLVEIMSQVLEAVAQLQSFLLMEEDLILKPELIFESNGGGELSFCYLPGYQQSIRQSLRELIEYLLPKLDHKNQRAVTAGYGIYRKIMEENWNLEELKETLFEQQVEKEGEPKSREQLWEEKESQEIRRDQLLDQFFAEEEEAEPLWKRWIGPTAVAFLISFFLLFRIFKIPWWICLGVFGTALVLAGAGVWYWRNKRNREPETTERKESEKYYSNIEEIKTSERNFLADSVSAPKRQDTKSHNTKSPNTDPGETELIYRKEEKAGARLVAVQPASMQTIFLEKELILVGTLPQAVDAVIPSSAVSRIHARIKRVDGGFALCDLSSKNGTFVNAHMLIGEEECHLKEGDEVQFAEAIYRYFDQ